MERAQAARSAEFQHHLQKRRDALYSMLRSEFLKHAVGPWVSVAGRETALARGNPAIRKEEVRIKEGRNVVTAIS